MADWPHLILNEKPERTGNLIEGINIFVQTLTHSLVLRFGPLYPAQIYVCLDWLPARRLAELEELEELEVAEWNAHFTYSQIKAKKLGLPLVLAFFMQWFYVGIVRQ